MWVFGYGSLCGIRDLIISISNWRGWKGYRRSFCMSSIHHRGTVKDPGLVLALDKSEVSECYGLAFNVAPENEQQTLEYLRERELISSAYLEINVEIVDADGVTDPAVTYVIDQNHVQYCAGLALPRQAEIISTAVGDRGHNAEYLFNTVDKLKSLDIRDAELEWLATRRTQDFGCKYIDRGDIQKVMERNNRGIGTEPMDQTHLKLETQFTQPVRQITMMLAVVAMTTRGDCGGTQCFANFLCEPLAQWFYRTCFLYRGGELLCTGLQLISSVRWIENFVANRVRLTAKVPKVLAPLATLLGTRSSQMKIAATSTQSILTACRPVSKKRERSRDIL